MAPSSPRTTPRYKWIVLSNTTLGMLMATINASIVIISLPAIFGGIHLNPLQPGNASYLLWMLMGYMLVTAVLVTGFGRLGDMFDRVRICNAGFVVFSLASVALAPRINQVAGMAGSFVGLIVGGLLAVVHWRAVFFVSVPIGIAGTIWSYLSLHESGTRTPVRFDVWGNLTFAIGLTAILTGITYGIQPYGGSSTGWGNPTVLSAIIGGALVLAVFAIMSAVAALASLVRGGRYVHTESRTIANVQAAISERTSG